MSSVFGGRINVTLLEGVTIHYILGVIDLGYCINCLFRVLQAWGVAPRIHKGNRPNNNNVCLYREKGLLANG